MSTAVEEAEWWNALEGDDVTINTVGSPPYNHSKVAEKIIGTVASGDSPRILDLGCGTGRLTNHIGKQLGGEASVYGVDISFQQITKAVVDINHPPNTFYYRCDGRSIPDGIRKITGAYSVTMFQHIPDDAKWAYIHAVHERLRPGGVFMFTVAEGSESKFLDHQIPDIEAFGDDLAGIWEEVEVERDEEWTWVTVWKLKAG